MNKEISNQLDELASKPVSRKKFLGFGLAVAATAMFSGFLGKSKAVADTTNLSPAKEKRLNEIYKSITNVKK